MPRTNIKHPSLPGGTIASVNKPYKARIEAVAQNCPEMSYTQLRKELVSDKPFASLIVKKDQLSRSTIPNLPSKPRRASVEDGLHIYSNYQASSWLRRLPFEIRDILFAKCVDIVDGRSPPLLVALRGDTELYLQCLEHYYETNYYTLNSEALQFLNDLSPKAISRMTKLCIEIKYSDIAGTISAHNRIIPQRLQEATNVTTLMFRSPLGISGSHDHWVRNTLIILPGITKVIFDGDTIPTQWNYPYTMFDSVTRFNFNLNVIGRNIEERYNGENVHCFLWEDQFGKRLMWTIGPGEFTLV